jgi:mannan endo-1,4-beta-mannosidase
MKSRLAAALAVAMAALAVIATGFHFISESSPPVVAHAKLPVSPASYLGVYEQGAPPSYQPIADFARVAGGSPNLDGYFSGWAEPFATKFARQAYARGAATYVQIDPTFASVSGIASGAYDPYLRAYADSVRNFGHAVVIGFGHEMNAPWYSWGYGHVKPATFIKAWRHIVTLFHGQGADNVTWLWTINADMNGTGNIKNWWPGPQYVSWVGIDGFYYKSADTFDSVFGQTIAQVRSFTGKPLLVAETAVGPRAGQFVKIGDLFAGVRANKMLGLVWFDFRQHGSLYHQDWRVEGSLGAQAAFKLGVSSALDLAKPSSSG